MRAAPFGQVRRSLLQFRSEVYSSLRGRAVCGQRPGYKRSHRGSLPAEYRIELRDGRAIISRPCRADFAATD